MTFWRALDPALRARLLYLYAGLTAFNLAVWAAVLFTSRSYPIILPTAALAYGFGLRHAVDADHIAAIDNSTRKLMAQGERPVAVGLFFSLGHASVVAVLCLAVAASASFVAEVPALRSVGANLGLTVSAGFLLLIGLINLAVLANLIGMFRAITAGSVPDEQSLEDYLASRGLLARLLRPALVLVRRSWHMYPLGLLFGLGFDTASEVALLGLAATGGAAAVPLWYLLLLPAVFAAGMALVDATDGVLMLGAYGWAYLRPVRKLYYNLNITAASALVALAVGGVEALGVIGMQLGLSGGVWDLANHLDMGVLGLLIIVFFAVSWIGSTLFYRMKHYDELGWRRPQGGAPPTDDAPDS